MSAQPMSAPADGHSAITLTVTVRSGQGNPMAGQTVKLTPGGLGDTLSASTGVTNAAGQFSAQLTSVDPGYKQPQQLVADFQLGATVLFTPLPADASQSTFTALPPTVPADGVSKATLTVTVKSASGAPVASQPVTLTASGSMNTLTPATGATDSNGVLVSYLSSTVAETKNLTATIGNFTLDATVVFVAQSRICATGPGWPAPTTTFRPQQVRTADLNGDGILDVLIADSPISVLIGNGDGAFVAGATVSAPDDAGHGGPRHRRFQRRRQQEPDRRVVQGAGARLLCRKGRRHISIARSCSTWWLAVHRVRRRKA